jgi:hypothetical protein
MNTPQGPQPPYRHNQPPPHRYPPPPPQAPQQYRPAPPPPPQQYRGQPPPPPPQQYRGQPPPPPQHHQPPQYGQPPAPQQPGQQPSPYGQSGDGIVVNMQFFPLAWLLFFFKPKIALDGQEMPVSGWGRTHLPARPGQHHVQVHVPYFLPPKLGPAETAVDVRPGQVAELEYKAPLWSFSAGSLGVGPQKYNGVGITLALVLLPFVLLFLFILFFVVLAAI